MRPRESETSKIINEVEKILSVLKFINVLISTLWSSFLCDALLLSYLANLPRSEETMRVQPVVLVVPLSQNVPLAMKSSLLTSENCVLKLFNSL